MTTFVTYTWPARFRSLPTDHGYALFGALSSALPGIHEGPWQVCPIRGKAKGREVAGPGTLTIRGPLVSWMTDINRRRLRIGTRSVALGECLITAPDPTPCLRARFVTIKNAVETDDMRAQLDLRFHDLLEHIPPFSITRRRVMQIGGRLVVGFGVDVFDLSEDDSLALQSVGIGGRRRMGGGVFLPAPGPKRIEGRWFMTPHAVRKFLERHGARVGVETFEAARAWMIEDSIEAHFIHNAPVSGEVWVGRKPWKIRYVIGHPDREGPGVARPAVTVLSDKRGNDARQQHDRSAHDGPQQ